MEIVVPLRWFRFDAAQVRRRTARFFLRAGATDGRGCRMAAGMMLAVLPRFYNKRIV
jgi:hypothetical protein